VVSHNVQEFHNVSLLFMKYCWDGQIKENKVDGACSMP
jgi:hypothetical protein